jgi:protein involved in ribonucleotide reduction
MKVAFASMTGKVKEFAGNLEFETVHIKSDTVIDEPFVLITYTIRFGEIPDEVEEFLKHNSVNLVAVVGSGDTIWGNNFCKGAKTISQRYNIPLLHTFEKSGLKSDLTTVTNKIREIERMV